MAGADALLARCAVHGTRRVEVGMAHRGRLAMLSTLLNKPPGTLFAKMENAQSDYAVGDVTYHLGETATLTYTQVPSTQSAEHTVVKTLQYVPVNDLSRPEFMIQCRLLQFCFLMAVLW